METIHCRRLGACAAAVIAALLLWPASPVRAMVAAADTLVLQRPENLKVWRTYDAVTRGFRVFMSWEDLPDSVTTVIHPPDTTGWRVLTPPGQLSLPSARGEYIGDIDRTLKFAVRHDGTVGVTSPLEITVEIRKEETTAGVINVGAGYVPGTFVDLGLRNTLKGNIPVDLGIQVAFSPGDIDRGGGFIVGAEDYEGFHVWRGIESDGRDLTVIAEVSKEEAFLGSRTGGNFIDSLYLYQIIPTLRNKLTWFSAFGAVECLGTSISLPLAARGLFWFDCNTFNGFTYYYAVTTFDRGYNVTSGRQGLVKRDDCPVAAGQPFPCPSGLFEMKIEVDPQSDLNKVYVVPNPYRSGGSRLTSDNYHNFPDDAVRFVNVPLGSTLRVYTLAGDLVWDYFHNSNGVNGGNVEWNLRNRGAQEIGSGVYIYRVRGADGGEVYGRLVVIR